MKPRIPEDTLNRLAIRVVVAVVVVFGSFILGKVLIVKLSLGISPYTMGYAAGFLAMMLCATARLRGWLK